MAKEIYVIDDTDEITNMIQKIFKKDEDYKIKTVRTNEIEDALRNIPDLFIINEDVAKIDIIECCKKIRKDEDNSITPIIVVSSNLDKEHKIEVLKIFVEYYIEKPFCEECIYYQIKNIIRLIDTNRRISPLTGLPRKCTNISRTKKEGVKQRKVLGTIFRLRQF